MTDEKLTRGKKGEQLACDFLTNRGHTIVRKNWRASHKEIDIISLKDKELHIVEVKSKTEPVVADPVLSINKNKLRNLVCAANAFLNSGFRNHLPQDLEVMFDVVTVVFGADGIRIEYYPQAYIPTYV